MTEKPILEDRGNEANSASGTEAVDGEFKTTL